MKPAEIVALLREGHHPTIRKPTVPEVLPIVNAYYKCDGRGVGGAAHIVLDDDDSDQYCADWCLRHSLGLEGDAAEYDQDKDHDVFLTWLLTMCSSTQRHKLYLQAGGPEWDTFDANPDAVVAFWGAAEWLMQGREVTL